MFHLDDGTLRRLIDEPESTLSSAQAHYAECESCRGRADQLRQNADAVAQAYAGAGAGLTEQVLLDRSRIRAGTRSDGVAVLPQRRRSPLAAGLIAVATAAALVVLFIFTPLGTLAQGFLTIFEPQQFQPIAVTPLDRSSFRYMPNLDEYGTVREFGRPQSTDVASAAQAASLARIPLRVPGIIPGNVARPVQWHVVSAHNVVFTFSAAKTAASAAARHQALPPMPRGLDGSTLQITVGPVVATTFGATFSSGARAVRHHDESPGLVIAQAPLPRLQSTGASVRQIEDYLLRQPGIPPQLAAQIRSISDPSSTLPIPVPIDKASAQRVIVQGVAGLAVGDNTGIGAGVIWQRDGFIYGVAGPFSESEVLEIANSLR